MKPLVTLLAVSLPFCSLADTPTPTEAPAAVKDASLKDQLIDSIRQDLQDMRGKDPTGTQSLAMVLDALIRSAPRTQSDLKNTNWSSQIFALGSKRSGDIALSLIRQIQKENAEQAPKIAARVDEVAKRVASQLFQAKTAAEFQPLILELESVTPSSRLYADEHPASQQLQALTYWVTRWQTQLAQREAGQNQAALQTLQTLAQNDQAPRWIDRAEMLRQIQAANNAAGKPTPEEFTRQLATLSDKALAAATPADIDPLLSEAQKLRSYSSYSDDRNSYKIGNLTFQLQNLQDALIAAKDGDTAKLKQLSERVNGSYNDSNDGPGIPRSKWIERIKQLTSIAKPTPPSDN